MTATFITQALEYTQAGLSVIPIAPGTKKTPDGFSWKTYQTRLPVAGEIKQWVLNYPGCGFGVVAGKVSGGAEHPDCSLEVLDIEGRAQLERFHDEAERRAPGLLARLPIVSTPSGGRHIYFRCKTTAVQGNQKLAMRAIVLPADELDALRRSDGGVDEVAARKKGYRLIADVWYEIQTLIETRGEGGQVLSPFCPPGVHPSGGIYETLNLDPRKTPEITMAEREALLAAARACNEFVDQQRAAGAREAKQYRAESQNGNGLRPGDDYNTRAGAFERSASLIESNGWAKFREAAEGVQYSRPGVTDHSSATLFYNGHLYVFTTSAHPLEGETAYAPFGLYGELEHSGDYSAAAKALAAQGYGDQGTQSTRSHSEPSSAAKGEESSEWDAPQALPDGLRPVPKFIPALIPQGLRNWLCDIAERLQVPLDYPAAAAVVLLASLVGNQLRIRPKRRDDWTMAPNLWGAIVGRPGTMKTPAISEVFKPLYRLVKQAEEQFNERQRDFKFEVEKLEIRKIAQREEMKKAAKKGLSLDAFDACNEEVKEPTERRYVVNDSTVEKQGEILNQNPNGILVFRDELTGWLRSLDDERRANDRAFHLESWNGGPYTYDRIGRGTLKIPSTTTSIFGGIQPSPLAAYLRAALAIGGDDGLFQRFQVMVYPDAPKEWRNIDRWPDGGAKDQAFAIFERLATLNTESAEMDESEKPFLRFTEEAQAFFDEWLTDIMGEIRGDKIEHPLLESHLTKYRKLMPSLALIFHLCDEVDGGVSLHAAQMAAAWCTYLWEHAQRIYGLALNAVVLNARTLAKHLRAGDLENGFTAREVAQRGWAGLATVETAKEAIETLALYGWLRGTETRNPAGGRPTVTYSINPRVSEVRL